MSETNQNTSLTQAINDMRTMRESYDQLAAAQASLAENVQAIKDAHILGFSYDGIIFDEGYEPRSAFGIIAEREKIIEIHDSKDYYIPKMTAADYPKLEVFDYPGASESYYTNGWGYLYQFLANSASIKKVILTNFPLGGIYQCFSSCTNLVYVDMLNATFNGSGNFAGCLKLIDLHAGKNATSSINLGNLNPTEALSNNDTSLLSQADIDAGFTSNREKLLYNIREHIAANLPDRTDDTPFTITFSQTLRDAFDQETDDTFAAKNWDIAPARS